MNPPEADFARLNEVLGYGIGRREQSVRWACSQGVPMDDAEDVVQEVLRKVWELGPRVRNVESYWWQAVRNGIRAYQRRRYTRQLEFVEFPSPGPEEGYLEAELAAEIREAVASVPASESQRAAFWRWYVTPNRQRGNRTRERVYAWRFRKKAREHLEAAGFGRVKGEE